MQHNRTPQEQGFTLVELLIVVIILAILAAIVVPQFASSTDDAESSAADSTLANLRGAIDLYYQQHGEYPGNATAVPAANCATATKGTGTAADAANRATAFLEQMSLYSNKSGESCSSKDTGNFTLGPYLKKGTLPAEPFSNVAVLEVVNVGDLNLTATGNPGPGGYKYDSVSGKIIVNLLAEQAR